MKSMTVQELKEKLDTKQVCLVDVREPCEYLVECIEESILIPLAQLTLETLPKTDKPIVIHCVSGSRSLNACQKLLTASYNLDISTLEGGINAWKDAGFPIKKLRRFVIPIDRQVLLITGLLVFLGLILGTFYAPGFYLLSGFISLGLMFAGLTGACTLAKLLAFMPWNK